jgi:hypothetical protein
VHAGRVKVVEFTIVFCRRRPTTLTVSAGGAGGGGAAVGEPEFIVTVRVVVADRPAWLVMEYSIVADWPIERASQSSLWILCIGVGSLQFTASQTRAVMQPEMLPLTASEAAAKSDSS